MSERAKYLWTRREFLIEQAIIYGAWPFLAREAVASVAIEHPEWDMDEKRPWSAWERDGVQP